MFNSEQWRPIFIFLNSGSLFLPKIWISGIWQETHCVTIPGAGILDPRPAHWVLTPLLLCAWSVLSLHWWPLNCSWFHLTLQEGGRLPALGVVVLAHAPDSQSPWQQPYFTQILPAHIPSLEDMGASRLPAYHTWAKWFCQTNMRGQRTVPWAPVQVLLHPASPGHLVDRKCCWAWKLPKSQVTLSCPGYFIMLSCEMEKRISGDFHFLCLPATRAGV